MKDISKNITQCNLYLHGRFLQAQLHILKKQLNAKLHPTIPKFMLYLINNQSAITAKSKSLNLDQSVILVRCVQLSNTTSACTPVVVSLQSDIHDLYTINGNYQGMKICKFLSS